MIQVTPVTSLTRQSHKTKARMCLIVVYKCIHIFLGIDFGFFDFDSYKTKVMSKVFAVLQSLLLIYFAVYKLSYSESWLRFWYLSFLFRYLLCVFAGVFSSDHTFCKLIQGTVNPRMFSLEVKLLLSIFLFFIYRLSLIIGYCCINSSFSCVGSFLDSFLFSLVLFATNVIIVTHTFAFLAINSWLNGVASEFKSSGVDVSKQRLFKHIIDVAEQHKSSFDPVFLTTLLFNIPQVMATIYTSVQDIKLNGTSILSLNTSIGLTTSIEIMVLTIMPAISAGLIAAQIEKIKVILHEALQQIRDVTHVQEIERFIRYVEARPCRFRVYKVVPLDADLIGMVFSFCVTYLIVIIQFTHLY